MNQAAIVPNAPTASFLRDEDALRGELRTAIQARDNCAKRRAKAADACERAAAFVARLEAGLAEFSDIDARIAGERADKFREALVAGEAAPCLDASPELAALAGRRLNIENQIAAASQAQESLAAELADEQAALEACESRVREAAKAVVAHFADTTARELYALEQKAGALRRRLTGVSQLRPAHIGKIPVAASTIALLRDQPHNAVFTKLAADDIRFWDNWLAALCSDSEALPDD